jgi:hypothetical protein
MIRRTSRRMALPSLVITMPPMGSMSICEHQHIQRSMLICQTLSIARGPRHVRMTSATVCEQ